MANELTSRRIPWIALALSFMAMGVGHIYCGRIVKGIPLYFTWLLIPICIAIAVLLPPSTASFLFLLLLPVVVVAVVYFYAAINACRTASQIGSDYSLRDYNRPPLYWLLIVTQIAFSIGLTVVVNSFIFEVFVIPTESMSPTILGGDRIVAKKMTPTNHFPSRGDLIVYQNPTLVGGDRFVGRAVAVAGDKIRIDGESVLVNDSELVRERVPNESLKLFGERVKGQVEFEVNSGRRYLVSFQEPRSGNDEEDVFETTVPERHVFVLGDNRSKSRDSRQFGSIHSGDIVGYVQYIHWPAQSWSRFGVADDRLP